MMMMMMIIKRMIRRKRRMRMGRMMRKRWKTSERSEAEGKKDENDGTRESEGKRN